MIVLSGHTLDPESVWRVSRGEEVRLAGEARQAMTANLEGWEPVDVLALTVEWLAGTDHAPYEERVRAFVLGHCAGVGPPLSMQEVRALMVCRANVLAGGFSGCRPEVVDLLLAMLNQRVHPWVPCQGSVGAAGDLAPLAHVAAVALRLGGKAERAGYIMSAAEAMQGLPQVQATSKETLSLINGATFVVSEGALCLYRARQLLFTAERALAMSMAVVLADTTCLSDSILALRGHKGALESARRVRELLRGSELASSARRPDAFSIRCAPAVLGAAWDALEYVEKVVRLELNGACDNPLLVDGELLHGGNFHGAPVALALDFLKAALTQVASVSERRTFRLTHGQLSGNLPSFLIESNGVNSGFMLAQYTAASLVSECKGLSHPSSVDSIPTGQHHEDHVSMGPISARTLASVLAAVESVVAIEALVAAQGLEFRREGRSWDSEGQPLPPRPVTLSPAIRDSLDRVRQVVPRWTEDRVLHRDLQAAIQLVRGGALV